jgi:hypothetical protein
MADPYDAGAAAPPPADAQSAETLLDHYRIVPRRRDQELLWELGEAFTHLPYENLTKLIRKHGELDPDLVRAGARSAPGAAAPGPGAAAPGPGVAAPGPGGAAPGPGAAAPGPGVAAPGPGGAAPGPGGAAPGPGGAAPGPGAAAPGPGGAAPGPGATGSAPSAPAPGPGAAVDATASGDPPVFAPATAPLRRRGPAEVVADHLRWGTGGTCFALTETFLTVLRRLGYRCRPVLCDMKAGADTHCAVLIELPEGPHLMDPGYLLHRPLPLPRAPGEQSRRDAGVAEVRLVAARGPISHPAAGGPSPHPAAGGPSPQPAAGGPSPPPAAGGPSPHPAARGPSPHPTARSPAPLAYPRDPRRAAERTPYGFDVYTGDTWRYRMKPGPVSRARFLSRWDDSFGWSHMNNVHLSRALPEVGGYAYLHGHRLRVQARDGKQNVNLRGRLAAELGARFNLAPEVVERAYAIAAALRAVPAG